MAARGRAEPVAGFRGPGVLACVSAKLAALRRSRMNRTRSLPEQVDVVAEGIGALSAKITAAEASAKIRMPEK